MYLALNTKNYGMIRTINIVKSANLTVWKRSKEHQWTKEYYKMPDEWMWLYMAASGFTRRNCIVQLPQEGQLLCGAPSCRWMVEGRVPIPSTNPQSKSSISKMCAPASERTVPILFWDFLAPPLRLRATQNVLSIFTKITWAINAAEKKWATNVFFLYKYINNTKPL